MFQSYSANGGWEWFQSSVVINMLSVRVRGPFFPVYSPWLQYSNRQRDNNTLEGEVDEGE